VIDLVLVPFTDCFSGTVSVEVRLVAEEPTWVHAVDLAFGWDPRELRLVGCSHATDTVGNTLSGIPGLGDVPLMPWDFYGANASLEDGNAYFLWLGPLTGASNPTLITNDVVATLEFERVGNYKTTVSALEVLDIDYPLVTRIYAGDVPGADLLDGSKGAKVAPCSLIMMVVP